MSNIRLQLNFEQIFEIFALEYLARRACNISPRWNDIQSDREPVADLLLELEQAIHDLDINVYVKAGAFAEPKLSESIHERHGSSDPSNTERTEMTDFDIDTRFNL